MVRSLIALVALAGCSEESVPVTSSPPPSPPPSPAPSPCEEGPARDGEATYYDADGTGNCSFDASPDDLLVAALNDVDYAGSAACGACARVEGPDGTVDVRIVDRCPECAAGDIDLSPEAFARIAPLEAGRVAASWRFVPCAVSGPIALRFKEGSSEFWTAVQVRNHRHAVASLAFRSDDALVEVPRLEYNYFVYEAGMGPGPYTFVVTDVVGQPLEVAGVALAEAETVATSEQFPACTP